jgi:hypothetical protein
MDGSELDESFNPNKIGKKMIQFFINLPTEKIVFPICNFVLKKKKNSKIVSKKIEKIIKILSDNINEKI